MFCSLFNLEVDFFNCQLFFQFVWLVIWKLNKFFIFLDGQGLCQKDFYFLQIAGRNNFQFPEVSFFDLWLSSRFHLLIFWLFYQWTAFSKDDRYFKGFSPSTSHEILGLIFCPSSSLLLNSFTCSLCLANSSQLSGLELPSSNSILDNNSLV